ncbi:MAG: hypothetical protein AAF629_34580 [Chloroflexota bacterium]
MKLLRRFLVLSLLAFIIGSGYAPWVYRAPVALQLTPPGLAEYVKFLHEVRFGQLPLERLYFLLPLAVAAFSTSLIVVNRRLALHASMVTLFRLSVLPMALSLLSPIWAPARLMNDEFRLQTIVAGAAIGVAIIAPLFKKIPLSLILFVVSLTSIGSVYLALDQFNRANAAISATYAGPILLGWGGWLAAAGAAGITISALWIWLVPKTQ